MGKKKRSHAHEEKPSQETGISQQKQEEHYNMDSDHTWVQFENLKSLNRRMVFEAIEYRQLVESLRRDKESLEAQLNQSIAEVATLNEEVVGLKLEKNVVSAYVSEKCGALEKRAKDLKSKEGEMKSVEEKEVEIAFLMEKLGEMERLLGEEKDLTNRVSVERDEVVEKLSCQVMECEALKTNLSELQEEKRQMENEMVHLRTSFDGRIVDLAKMSLVESNKLVDGLKEELTLVVRVKAELAEKKDVEMRLRQDLERKFMDGEAKREEMEREISQLMEENKAVQEMSEELVKGKTSIEENLGKVSKELDDERSKLQAMVGEKTMLMREKTMLEAQLSKFRKFVDELKYAASELQKSGGIKEAKIMNLEAKLGDYKRKLDFSYC